MEATKKIRTNLSTFDLVRGIAIFFVIFGHMVDRYSVESLPVLTPLFFLSRILSSGLMPMFFILSGFGFKAKPTVKLLKKTFSEMIIPYLWVAAFSCVTYPVLRYPFVESSELIEWSIDVALGFLFGLSRSILFLGHETSACQAVWFMLALFCSMNILNQIVKVKNTIIQVLLVVLCVGTGYILILKNFAFYCIAQSLLAVGFCYIGYIIKQQNLLERGLFSIWSYIVLVPVFIIQVLSEPFDMIRGGFDLLDYCMAGGSGILFVFLGVLSSRFQCKGLDWIKKIGMYSYWIICIHSVEMQCFPWFALGEMIPYRLLLLTFITEVLLKVGIIAICCKILKKISQYKYKKKRMALYGR